MARKDHRFVLTIKDRWLGESLTIHLVQDFFNKGVHDIRYQGRYPKRRRATNTQIGQRVSKFLIRQQGKLFNPIELAR